METKRITAVQRTALFGCLTEKELADIAQRAMELHFKKGEMLFLSREEAKGLFVSCERQDSCLSAKSRRPQHVMHVDSTGIMRGSRCRDQGEVSIEYDEDKVDEMIRALLHLTTFKDGMGMRAWKGHHWSAITLEDTFPTLRARQSP
jgi:hypothetical protein